MVFLIKNIGKFGQIIRKFAIAPIIIEPCVATKSIVTIADLSCPIGKNLALLLLQCPLITELRLYDEHYDTCALARSLSELDVNATVKSYKKGLLRDAVTDATVVVSAGGCATSLKQTKCDLFKKNADGIRLTAMYLAEFNPEAIFVIAKPPIEALVPMASEEYIRVRVYDNRKIIGAGTFESMLTNHVLAQCTNKNPSKFGSPIVGGLSPDLAVPVLSSGYSKADKLCTCMQHLIENAEKEVIKAKERDGIKGGMMCLPRAAAIYRFVCSLLRALQDKEITSECAFVRQTGHIGKFLPYMASIVRLGPNGIWSRHMPKLNEAEEKQLKTKQNCILECIRMGESFSAGDYYKGNRTCDVFVKRRQSELDKRLGLDKKSTCIEKQK